MKLVSVAVAAVLCLMAASGYIASISLFIVIASLVVESIFSVSVDHSVLTFIAIIGVVFLTIYLVVLIIMAKKFTQTIDNFDFDDLF